jgi:TolB protein
MRPGYGGGTSWVQTTGLGTAEGRLTIDVAGDLGDADWSPDGRSLVFAAWSQDRAELWTVAADGTGPVRLATCAAPCGSIERPAWSPGGSQIAYVEVDRASQASVPTTTRIVLLDVSTAERRIVVEGDAGSAPVDPRWSPDGSEIVYSRLSFDQSGHTAAGTIHLISADGTNDRPLTNGEIVATAPDWSPDGQTIVFETGGDRDDVAHNLYAVSIDGSGQRALTSLSPEGSRAVFSPRWSQDGTRIVYVQEPLNGPGSLMWMAADGSDPVVLFGSGGRVFPFAPSVRH